MSEVITSRSNGRVKQLRAAFDEQARLAAEMIAIEGEHLVREALKSGHALTTVFLSEPAPLPSFLPSHVEVVRVEQDIFQSCVRTQAPQGIAALLKRPVWRMDDLLRGTPLLVVAVGLQDPGNLGTLIRSAEAFGATGMLTTPGTVSLWNQKAVRASAGSVFRVPVVAATADSMEQLERSGVKLLAALKDNASSIGAESLGATLCGPCGIMIGNEGAGLPQEWIALAKACVTIPCPGPVESLNAAVAGSILLYEVSRRRGMAV